MQFSQQPVAEIAPVDMEEIDVETVDAQQLKETALCNGCTEVIEQKDKGEAYKDCQYMMERGQLVADGEGSDAETVMGKEADASRDKSDGGGGCPGEASVNHGA